MKKILAMLLCASLILSLVSIPSFAKTNEVPNDLEIVSSLGIMGPIYMTEPEKILTRGEVIEAVANILGGSAINAELPFADVTADNKYYVSASKAYAMGLIDGYGDNTLRLEQTASVADAAKMLVCALGYKELLNGGMRISTALLKADVGSVADGGNSSPITASKLAGLIMDACESPMADLKISGSTQEFEYSNELLMEHYMDIHKIEEVVTANEFTALNSQDGVGDGKLKLGTELYTDKNGIYGKYLGYNTVCYYKDDGSAEKEIIYMYPYRNEVVTITSDNIVEYSSGTLYYKEDGKNEKLQIKLSVVDFIYNNSFETAPSSSDFIFDSGEVTIIDNDNDKKYDFLRIDSYENYVVSYVDRTCSVIFGKYNSEPIYVDDYEKVSFLSDKNDVMYLEELSEWDVISTVKSRNGKNLNMLYSTRNIDGKIDGKYIDDNKTYLTINEKDYRVTADCIANQEKELKPGNSAEFCLDIFGNIAAVRTDDYEKYGWLIVVDQQRELGSKIVQAKLMNAEGIVEIKNLSKNVLFDGEKKKSTDLGSGYYCCLISYKENNEGEISYIDTIEPGSKEIVGSTLGKYYDGYTVNSDTGLLQNNESLKFKAGGRIFGGKVAINSKTLIFKIPFDETIADEEDYWSLPNSYFRDDDSEYIQAYRRYDDKLAADVVVLYHDTSAVETVKNDTAITIIDKINYVRDENDDFVAKLSGYRANAHISYKLADESVIEGLSIAGTPCKLTKGDAVKLSVNERNEIVACEVIYSNQLDILSTTNPSGSLYDIFYIQLAYAYQKDGNLCYTTTTDLSNPSFSGDMSELSTLELRNLANYSILRVDNENRIVELADSEHIADYIKASTGASKLLIYDRYGDPRTLVIYE